MPDDLIGRICNSIQPQGWSEQHLHNGTFLAIGIHPWHVKNLPHDWAEKLYKTLVQNPEFMVGEIGIDKYHEIIETQQEIFITQLDIAARLQRPIHMHCVKAWDRILHIFKTHKMPPAIVAHAFNGGPEIISELATKYNVFFSYSVSDITPAIAKRIENTPKNRILVESDTDDVTQQMPKIIRSVDAIAEILGIRADKLADLINENFNGVIQCLKD